MLWSEGHFIISLHEKLTKIYYSQVFESCEKSFWGKSGFLLWDVLIFRDLCLRPYHKVNLLSTFLSLCLPNGLSWINLKCNMTPKNVNQLDSQKKNTGEWTPCDDRFSTRSDALSKIELVLTVISYHQLQYLRGLWTYQFSLWHFSWSFNK